MCQQQAYRASRHQISEHFTPFYARFWKYRTKFRTSACNFDNTAQCTVIWKEYKHFGMAKPLFVIVQPISAEVHEGFVIVQHSANASLFGEVQAI